MQSDQKEQKFLVVGLGPIGGIFACHLAARGHKIYGLDIRQDHIEAIQENGITLKGLTQLNARLVEAATHLKNMKERRFDHIIISVKTPFMAKAISELKDLQGEFRIVSMQNGIDNEDYLAECFDSSRVSRMVVNFAGNITAPGVIKMTFFHKPNYVGCICSSEFCEHAKEFADTLQQAGLDTEATEDIKKYTWKKTILVAGLAPISALLGITMADVMSVNQACKLVEQLLRECIDVAKAANFDYGDEFLDSALEYLATAGPHKPSMLIDIETGNPTEIDYINGKIAFYGNKLNVPVPLNSAITALIKAREEYLGQAE